MDLENVTGDAGTTEVENTSTTDTSSVDNNNSGDSGSSAGDITPDQSTDLQAGENVYEPNFVFKVMDQEHEIPEAFRALIKSQEDEKMVREVFEKAYGLDHVKPKYETTKQQYEALQQEYNPVKEDLQMLGMLLQNKDLGSFFNVFKLTDEDILTYAAKRMEYYQLPPEQRAEIDSQNQRNLQYVKTMRENQKLSQRVDTTELNNTAQELKTFVSGASVNPIAEAFNSRAGQPDAFEKAVIAHAQLVFAQTKKDLSVPEAVQSFIKTFGLQGAPAIQSQDAGQAQSAGAAPASAQASAGRKPTLPKSSGSSASAPVKQKIKSIADIRKLQGAEMANNS